LFKKCWHLYVAVMLLWPKRSTLNFRDFSLFNVDAKIITVLPLDAPQREMPLTVVLIYSLKVRSLLMICYFSILLIDNL
jgi:hypothetical protein